MADSRSTADAAAEVSVLIVGAGPVGLVMACELARRAVSFRIIDTPPRSLPGSWAKRLQPRTLEVFYDLGIADRIVSLGRSGLQARSYRGEEVLGTHDINAGGQKPSAAAPYTRTMIIPQWRLEEELRQRLTGLGQQVERPVQLVARAHVAAAGPRCARPVSAAVYGHLPDSGQRPAAHHGQLRVPAPPAHRPEHLEPNLTEHLNLPE
jgi:2-polyprenyl-6-methoxyphenol hydroxylase-like FAD-dependent oxidoreductase